MATIPQPLINGVRHEYSSCEFKFNGRIFTGVKSVNYGIELAPSLVYGASPAPLGLTRGVLTPNADFEMLHAELYEMLDALGAGFGEVSFLGLVTISESWTTHRFSDRLSNQENRSRSRARRRRHLPQGGARPSGHLARRKEYDYQTARRRTDSGSDVGLDTEVTSVRFGCGAR